MIQLLLSAHSNDGARRKSSFRGQAHSFLSVSMVVLLLSDITKVLNFQGSISGELQPAFSNCATGPPFPASTNMCLLCKTWLPAAHFPRKASGAIITPAAQGIPCPIAELSCSTGAFSVWHQVQNNNAQCFTRLCVLWRTLWLRHNMILQAAFNNTPGLCRDRCGISNPQLIQGEWTNRVKPNHCLSV